MNNDFNFISSSNWKMSEMILMSSIKNIYENTNTDLVYDKIIISRYTYETYMSLYIQFKPHTNISELRSILTLPLVSNKEIPVINFRRIDYYGDELNFFRELMAIENNVGIIEPLKDILEILKFDYHKYPRLVLQYLDNQLDMPFIYELDNSTFFIIIQKMSSDLLISYLDKQLNENIIMNIVNELLKRELEEDLIISIIEKLDKFDDKNIIDSKFKFVCKFTNNDIIFEHNTIIKSLLYFIKNTIRKN